MSDVPNGVRVVLATANLHKAAEITAILGDILGDAVVLVPRPSAVPDVEETGVTLEDNAVLKARALVDATGLPALADDTGLEVDALGGAPGVYSARFAGPDATNTENVAKLLAALEELGADTPERRRARFRTVAALVYPDGRQVVTEGVVDGVIIAAEHATFFDPHLTFGMAASFEPLQMLGRVPFGELARLTLLGSAERLSATRAYEIGLVSEVVPGAELAERAGWAAGIIAESHPVAVQATLRALWAGRELSRGQALGLGWAFVGLGNSPEALAEGQQRFSSGQRIDWRLR